MHTFIKGAIASMALYAGAASAQAENADDAFDQVIAADVLAVQTGRENFESNSTLAAKLGDNALAVGSTGYNTISDNAFSNGGGIATVIQNSGNQVIIQNSTTVNLTTN